MNTANLVMAYKSIRELSWLDETPDHLATNCDEACDAMLRVLYEIDRAGYLACVEHYVDAFELPSAREVKP